MSKLKKGQLVELDVESAASEGKAVARLEGVVVFVRNAVPGDRVRALILRTKRKYAEAVVEEVLVHSPHRVDPVCQYFGTCGGCSWQNFDYPQQLEAKSLQVREVLRRIGGIHGVAVPATLASPSPYFYRNKMEFSFGVSRWLSREEISSSEPLSKGFALGLHIPRRFDKILDLETCHLQSALSAEIVNFVRDTAMENGWSAYHSRRHEGYLRNLVIRTAQRTGQILVNLVTSRLASDRNDQLATRLASRFPQITTFINSVNDTRSPVAFGDEHVLFGEGTIEEELAGLRFEIAATTFFQPNTLQAENLYQVARRFAALEGGETVYDLYCGIGSIALYLAPFCRQVIGIELQAQAVEDAAKNAIRNGIENCRFEAGEVAAMLDSHLGGSQATPDVVLVDPPRVGLGEPTCRSLLQLGSSRIVYVSCNPATQARDLATLSSGYQVIAVQPVDMFPQTPHIENVVALQKR